MNPQEGELRPQLLDRFALSVEIHGIRMPVSEFRSWAQPAFSRTPKLSARNGCRVKQSFRGRSRAPMIIDRVEHTQRNLLAIASDRLHECGWPRADLVILKASRAHAALEGRTSINDLDIALALSWRCRTA